MKGSNSRSIYDIKKTVAGFKGHKVQLEAHKSKKKLYKKTGVIESIYPYIFTVLIDQENADTGGYQPRMSFSYVDLLTKNVKIEVIDLEDGEPVAL